MVWERTAVASERRIPEYDSTKDVHCPLLFNVASSQRKGRKQPHSYLARQSEKYNKKSSSYRRKNESQKSQRVRITSTFTQSGSKKIHYQIVDGPAGDALEMSIVKIIVEREEHIQRLKMLIIGRQGPDGSMGERARTAPLSVYSSTRRRSMSKRASMLSSEVFVEKCVELLNMQRSLTVRLLLAMHVWRMCVNNRDVAFVYAGKDYTTALLTDLRFVDTSEELVNYFQTLHTATIAIESDNHGDVFHSYLGHISNNVSESSRLNKKRDDQVQQGDSENSNIDFTFVRNPLLQPNAIKAAGILIPSWDEVDKLVRSIFSLPTATAPGTSNIANELYRAIAESIIRDGSTFSISESAHRAAAMMLLQADARPAELPMQELHKKSRHTLAQDVGSVPMATDTNMNVYSPRFGSVTRKLPSQLAPLLISTQTHQTEPHSHIVTGERESKSASSKDFRRAVLVDNRSGTAPIRKQHLKKHRMNRLGLSHLTFMDDDIAEAERYLTYYVEKHQEQLAQLHALKKEVATRGKLASDGESSHVAPARQSHDFCRPLSGPDRLRAGLFNRKLFDKQMRAKQLRNEIKERREELKRKKLVRYNFIQAQANRVTRKLEEKWILERKHLMKKRRFMIKYERLHELNDPIPSLMTLEEEATIVLQSFSRMINKRRQHQRRLRRRQRHSCNIQRVWRGGQDRRKVMDMRRRYAGAQQIQRTCRGFLGRRRAMLARSRRDAAIVVQCGQRCCIARKKRRAKQFKRERQTAAVRMQCFSRTCQARHVHKMKIDERERHVAALKIELERRNAAISIQCRARQRQARSVTKRRLKQIAALRVRVVKKESKFFVTIAVASAMGYSKATYAGHIRLCALQCGHLARETVGSILSFQVEAKRREKMVADAQARICVVEAELNCAFETERSMLQANHSNDMVACVSKFVSASAARDLADIRAKRIANALGQANVIWAEAATAGIDSAVLRQARYESTQRLNELAKQHRDALALQREDLESLYHSQSRVQYIRNDLAIKTVLSVILPAVAKRSKFREALKRTTKQWVQVEWQGSSYARTLYTVPRAFFKRIATNLSGGAVGRSETAAKLRRKQEAQRRKYEEQMRLLVSQTVDHVTLKATQYVVHVTGVARAVAHDAVTREVAKCAAPNLVASFEREAISIVKLHHKEKIAYLVGSYFEMAVTNITSKIVDEAQVVEHVRVLSENIMYDIGAGDNNKEFHNSNISDNPTELMEVKTLCNELVDSVLNNNEQATMANNKMLEIFTSSALGEAKSRVVARRLHEEGFAMDKTDVDVPDEGVLLACACRNIAYRLAKAAADTGVTRASAVRNVAENVMHNTMLGKLLSERRYSLMSNISMKSEQRGQWVGMVTTVLADETANDSRRNSVDSVESAASINSKQRGQWVGMSATALADDTTSNSRRTSVDSAESASSMNPEQRGQWVGMTTSLLAEETPVTLVESTSVMNLTSMLAERTAEDDGFIDLEQATPPQDASGLQHVASEFVFGFVAAAKAKLIYM